MKAIFAIILFFATVSANATVSDQVKINSKNIAAAVEAFSPLARSGVEVYKLKPAKTVKEVLLALAIKEGRAENESDFNWVGKSDDAWGADSTNWGETTMRGAYAYITELDSDASDALNQPGNEKEKEKFEKNVKKAKEAFKLLLHTGVMFGVAPLGAVQCGVRFAALAIIDMATGKVYVFSKEGSGC